MIEFHWENHVISFDGRVIEDFSMFQPDSTRHHIAHVQVAELRVDKKGRHSLSIQMKGAGTVTTGHLDPEAMQQAQALVDEVERVRASL